MTKKKILLTILAVAVVCAISVTGTLAYLTATSNNGQAVQNTFVGSTGLFEPEDPDNPDPDLPEPPDPDPDNPDEPVPTPGPDDTVDPTAHDFLVVEHLVTVTEPTNDKPSGEMTLDTSKVVTWNSYKLQPGVNAPKDPYVFINASRKTDVPGWLYVEVTGLGDPDVTAAIDTTQWQELTGVAGPHGGKVFVHQTAADNGSAHVFVSTTMSGNAEINVLAQNSGNAIVVNGSIGANGQSAEEVAAALKHEIKVYAYMAQAVTGVQPADQFNTCFGG